MKKLVSLLLAAAMLALVVPVFTGSTFLWNKRKVRNTS